MTIASVAKAAIGVALAILLGCEPVAGSGTDGGVEGAATTPPTAALQPIGADALCKRLISECAVAASQELCLAQYFALRVSAACVSAVPTASCADLASTTSSVSETCFPPCTAGAAPVCNANGTITLCTDSNTTNVRDCRDECTAKGFTSWTGSCGTTYAGEVAARAQCWCR